MTDVGLRELRQNASDLVRRAEAGESFVIAVNGRPAARLTPVADRRWRRWEAVSSVFESPADPSWAAELAAWRSSPVDGIRDPFAPGEA